jgi:uncharacterized repeat protein (TIGR01451 family)
MVMRTGGFRRKAVLAAILAVVCVSRAALAQAPPASASIAVSPNVNVLRGVDDAVRGDALLQRQNEPVAAVSTRNPNHIMIAANDYRTVDIANDQGLGDTLTRVASNVKHAVDRLVATLLGRREHDIDGDEAIEKIEAGSGEAWIGVYLSNDGGKSYSSYFMPGYPDDSSVVGTATPAHGRAAASDPVLAAAPAGRFYLGAMVFDRDPVTKKPTFSQIVVSRFTDRNNSETGQNFHFDRMTLIDDGAISGRTFLDKPAIVADIARGSSDPAACGPVYIAYTVFDEREKDPLERSKILVASSKDCGVRFSGGVKISHRTVLNQGVSLAIRPSDGAVFAAYRSFSDNKIYITSSADGHAFTPPQVISGPQPLNRFDQPSLDAANGYSFRTNAFPTIAIDGDDTIFVAWQERLVADGNPRIVITSSSNAKTWTTKHAVEATRCLPTAAGPPSCGEANVGPQVMPALSFSRGRLMLAFYEARAGIDNVKWVPLHKASYITGLDVQLGVRVAALDSTGTGASVAVSHYEADSTGQIPLISSYDGHDYRHVNRPNLPMYAAGTVPFMGDYIALAPTMPFVPADLPSAPAASSTKPAKPNPPPPKPQKSGPFWRWATEPTDGPTPAFVAAWGDNRDVVFPLAGGTPKMDGPWSQYAPPGFGPCINPGSRNANVYSAFVSPRLIAGTPTSFKDLGIQRAFVLFVQNQTAVSKFYRLTIVDSPPGMDASFRQIGTDQNTRDVEVFALSTVTTNVFAIGQAGAAAHAFRVNIAEITGPDGTLVPDGDAANVVFNADESNPQLTVSNPTSELHSPRVFKPGDPSKTTPQIDNPQIDNPQIDNPQIDNPQIDNPQIDNGQIPNLQLTNVAPADGSVRVVTNVTNYTWQVANAGNTASSFAPIFNIAKDLSDKHVRLFIYKTYRTPTFSVDTNGGCVVKEVPHDEIISVIDNPQIDNPQIDNPQIDNPQIDNPQIDNSTFFVAPSDSTGGAANTVARRRGDLTLAAFQAARATADDFPLTTTDAPTMITLQVTSGTTPDVGLPPTAPDGAPLPVNPPIPESDFSTGGSALAVTATSNDVIAGVVQAIPEAATTGADLVVSSGPAFNVPPNATVPAGSVVTFSSFTVENTGGQATGGPFKYGFYLSSTEQIDPHTAVLLGSAIYSQSIQPGPTNAATLAGGSFVIPAAIATGPYFLGVRINSGDANAEEPVLFEPEFNDSKTIPIVVGAGANLVILNRTLTPSTLVAGQTTTASVTVANTGTAPAGASTTAFFLSTDTTLSGNDTQLGTVSVPPLAAGETATVQSALVVPPLAPSNTYTVIVEADSSNSVPEATKSDNMATTPLKVVANNTSTLSLQQQPTTAIEGHAIAPAVQIKVVDAQSAPLPGALVQMTLVPVSGSGVLSGTTSASTDALGIAAFSNLKVSLTGTYQLTASAPTLGSSESVTSGSFSVTANHQPTATADAYSVQQGNTLTVAAPGVLGNDSDADGDPITAALVSGVSHGQVTLNADGSLTYTPASGYTGGDAFVYRASDGVTQSADATVSITVSPSTAPTITFGASNPPPPASGSYTRDVIIPYTITADPSSTVASVTPQPVYVTDIEKHSVSRVDPAIGTVVDLYVGGDRFGPLSAAISPTNGKLYVAEDDQQRIFRMDQTGLNMEVVYDSATALAPGNPTEPIGVTFAPNGDLFFINTGAGANYGVWRIAGGTPGTPPVQLFTIPNVTAGQGIGLAFAANGDLFAVDQSSNQILKSSPPYSTASTFIGPGTLPSCTSTADDNGVELPFCLFGVAVNAAGDVFVAHGDAEAILRFDSAGTPLGTFASFSAPEKPAFMAFDAIGNLWVPTLDFTGQTPGGRVWRVAPNGEATVVASTPLLGPIGVAVPPTTGSTAYGTVAFTATSAGAPVTATDLAGNASTQNSPAVTIDKSLATFVVTNTNDAGDGSLRQAILNANGHSGVDTITFNIQPSGPHTIAPVTTLPTITDPTILDATTQPGWAVGSPAIELSGANVGVRGRGLAIVAGASTVRGFVINRWPGPGVWLSTQGGNTIAGNFIGTNLTGSSALPNGVGVSIVSAGNTLGPGNVISANVSGGVSISGASASSNVVKGNLVGTNAAGTAALGNGASTNGPGINIFEASNNTIGGGTAADRNVVSGNIGRGIGITASTGVAAGNVVSGNYIGTNITGTVALGNGAGTGTGVSAGVGIDTSNNTVVGNLISGGFGFGVNVNGTTASGNVIRGNFIGTDVNGTTALANANGGINVNGPSNTVGGSSPADRNIVSGNTGPGISILASTATGTLVINNTIGTNAAANAPIPNGGGIAVSSNGNTIGDLVGHGNVIAFNAGIGLKVSGGVATAIRGNAVFSNTGLGIDLGGNGVTNNDTGDGDSGANNLQNFPVVSQASVTGGTVTINGNLNSSANATFGLDFFASASCDASSFGEGARFLGNAAVITDGSGNATFSQPFAFPSGSGNVITATATDAAGNTSEFSQCATATAAPTTANLSIAKTHAPSTPVVNQPLTYTLTVSNAGPDSATTVTVTDALPASLTFVSASASQGSCNQSAGTVTCALGPVANGAIATATITVTPTVAQPVTNSASVSATETDPNAANNTASDQAVVSAFAPCGTPTFSGPYKYVAGADANIDTVGDFNHDGNLDIAVAIPSLNQVALLFGDGSGGFAAPAYVTTAPKPDHLEGADVNGDGLLDLITASPGTTTSTVSVLLNLGGGTFGPPTNITINLPSSFEVLAGDFNGDGHPDLVVGFAGFTAGNQIAVLLNNGDGTFGAPALYTTGPQPGNIVIEDFDGDGKLDLAVSNRAGTTVSILKGTGTGTFDAPVDITIGTGPRARKVGDLNGDGKPDLEVQYVSDGANKVALLFNNGAGGFGPLVDIPGFATPGLAVGADVNGDGKPDLAILDGASTKFLLGDGVGGFGPAIAFATGGGNGMSVGDFNGDGAPDFTSTIDNGQIWVLLNTCPGAQTSTDLTLQATPATVTVAAGQHIAYSVTATNQGSHAATGVTVSGAVRPGLELDGVSSGAASCAFTAVSWNCTSATLAVSDTLTVNLDVRATASGTRTAIAGVTALEADPNTADNTVTMSATVTAGAVVFTVTNTNNSGSGSLRQAITDANTNTGSTNQIAFAIPGTAPFTISPVSALPNITNPVVIDGTTQSGFTATPVIEINGASAGTVNGLFIGATGAGSTIKGLAINRFVSSGISLNAGNNVIEGNHIGIDPTGTIARANGSGININNSPGNRVGGTTAAARNVISGNTGTAVLITGSSATGNIVQGNYVGTDAAGSAAVPNHGVQSGVNINNGASNNQIGGWAAGAGNVVSGNTQNAITVFGATTSGNVIQGNLVGTRPSGATALGNAGIGVDVVGAPNTMVGGTGAAGNVISGNGTGIQIRTGASGTVVQGNLVGTDSTGTALLPNSLRGIHIEDTSGNTIGGTAAGAGNVIRGNGGAGVGVIGASAGNAIRGNSIFANSSLGIDLNEDAVTANDANDGDTGPNNGQNFPSLTQASVASGIITIHGSLNSSANTTFGVDFFASSSCDASGFGEGATFLGTASVTTDGSGNITFSQSFTFPAGAGNAITATATDAAGNTSEFSPCTTAVIQTPPTIQSVSPNTGRQNQNGLPITITGIDTHFTAATPTVNLGSGVTVTQLTVNSDTQLHVTVNISPFAPVQFNDVVVTTGNEVASLTGGFEVQTGAPVVTSASPLSAHQNDTSDVLVTAAYTHFTQGLTAASFGGGIVVNAVTVNSATQATVNVTVLPAASTGSRTITMSTPGDANALGVGAFTVLAGLPQIQSLTPNAGAQATTQTVTIAGLFTNFQTGVSQVTFGGNGVTAGTVTVNGPTQIQVPVTVVAGAAAGARTVTVTTGAEVASLVNGFTVQPGVPAITVIDPNVAVPDSVVSVTITSQFTNFVNGVTQARFGAGISVNGAAQGAFGTIAVNSPTFATAMLTVDAGAVLGPRDVTVQTGTEVLNVNSGFTVQSTTPTPPAMTTISPPSGATGVPINTSVTIQFSAPLDRTTVNTGNIRVTDTITQGYCYYAVATVPGTVAVDASARIVTFTPSGVMAVGRQYSVCINYGQQGTPQSIKDPSGNHVPYAVTAFTTGFAPDTTGPSFVAANIADGDASVPTNAPIVLGFTKPIDPITVPAGLAITTDSGVPVAGTVGYTPDYRQLTFTPSPLLSPNAAFIVSYSSALQDSVGTGLTNPGSITFTTAGGQDVSPPQFVSYSPTSGQTTGLVPTIAVVFNEPLNPLRADASAFYLVNNSTGGVVPDTTVTLSANRNVLTLGLSRPLDPGTAYAWYLFYAYDRTGNISWNAVSFTTAAGDDTTAPALTSASPPPNASDVPVNALVQAVVSEPVDLTAGPTIALDPAVVGLTVPATDYRTLTFTPSGNLAANTTYTVTVSNVRDLSGNVMPPAVWSFTTRASASTDTTNGTIVMTPANNATGVSTTTPIVLSLSKPVSPASVGSQSILVYDNIAGQHVAGSITIAGDALTLTFTPSFGYAGGHQICAYASYFAYLYDWAGNHFNYVIQCFTIAATADTTPPQVISVMPFDGATGIGPANPVTVTFSEPLRVQTTYSGNVALYNGSALVTSNAAISPDGTSLTFYAGNLAYGTTYTVVITPYVTDLAGNSLPAQFTSTFTTAPRPVTSRPQVIAFRPGTGATGVDPNSPVTFFLSQAVDPSTVPAAVYVSQNGVLITGTSTVGGNDRVVTFTPSVPFQAGALIEVWFTSFAGDVYGNQLYDYQTSFTISPTAAGIPPTVIASNPTYTSGNPVNIVIDVLLSKPMDPATITPSTFYLVDCGNNPVATTISVLNGGRLLRLTPSANLISGGCYYYYYLTTGARDVDGLALSGAFNPYFYVGAPADTLAPAVVDAAPADTFSNIGVNATIRLTFNKRIETATVGPETVTLRAAGSAIAYTFTTTANGDGTMLLTLTPLGALPDGTPITIGVTIGVTDFSGNPSAPFTATFTTAAAPDFTAASVVGSTVNSGDVDVPVTGVFSLTFDRAMDSRSFVYGSTIYLYDYYFGGVVPATLSFSPDRTQVTIAPNAPLAVNRVYLIGMGGTRDLTGNYSTSYFVSFTTALFAPAGGPQVVLTTPYDGLAGAPVNLQPEVKFDRPIARPSAASIHLTLNGAPVPVTPAFLTGDTVVTLVPASILQPNASYVLTIGGVTDTGGTAMGGPVVVHFATGPTIDLVAPTISAFSVGNGATTGTKPVLRLTLSEAIDPIRTTGGYLYNQSSGRYVNGVTPHYSADWKSITFTYPGELDPTTSYYACAPAIYDLAGNYGGGGCTSFTTAEGVHSSPLTVTAVTPPSSATGVPINATIAVRLSAAADPTVMAAGTMTLAPPVAGTVLLSADRLTLTYQASGNLGSNTSYSLDVSGFSDVDGNTLTPFSSSFTTAASAATGNGTTTLTTPVPGSTNVPVTTAIVLALSRPVSPVSIGDNTFVVYAIVSGNAVRVAGDITIGGGGTSLTFTPYTPLPSNTLTYVYAGYYTTLYDLAGNYFSYTATSFTTGAGTDTAAPQIVSVTPLNTATNVGPAATVTLVFSESLNPATINSSNFALYNGYANLNASISYSADDRMITMRASLPYAATITVAVGTGVQDIVGNALAAPFFSTFTTLPAALPSNPYVTQTRPASGATSVPIDSTITLYASNPFSAASLNGALAVTQNGVLIGGSVVVRSGGYAAVFTPDQPFARGALIQVFLTTGATDTAGTPFASSSQSFTTAPDLSGVSLQVTSSYPAYTGGNPTNTVVDVRFNKPIDPAYASSTYFYLTDPANNPVAAAVAQIAPDALRLTPAAPLASDTYFYYHVASGIHAADGTTLLSAYEPYFYTGSAADTAAPVVTNVAPVNGAANVGDNATIRFTFSEMMADLSLSPSSIALESGGNALPFSLSFNNANNVTNVTLTPQAPLPDNSAITLSLSSGITDHAGHGIAPQTVIFQTRNGADTTPPSIVYRSPDANQTTDVPTNTSTFTWVYSEPLDATTVNGVNVFVYQYTAPSGLLPGTVTLSADGSTVTLTLAAALAPSATFGSCQYYPTDLSGNVGTSSCVYFTTAAAGTVTPPHVTGTNPVAGATGAALNAQIEVVFDAPVSSTSFDQITLTANGSPVPFFTMWSSYSNLSGRAIQLVPYSLLAPNTTYTVTVAGVKDLAGNVMTAPYTFTFTTGQNFIVSTTTFTAAAVLVDGTATQLTNGQTVNGVSTTTDIRVSFSDPVSYASVVNGGAQLRLVGTDAVVPVTVTMSADGKTAILMPQTPLATGTQYRLAVNWYAAVFNQAGYYVSGGGYSFDFATE